MDMNGVTPIPAPIKITRLQDTIDSIGLGNGPSKLKISFLGAGNFRFRDFRRSDFSAYFLMLKIFWYSSLVQSPRFEIDKVKTVRFGSTAKSVMVKGCHSNVEIFSHCNRTYWPGRIEIIWFALKVRKTQVFVGISIEIVLIRVKKRLIFRIKKSKK